MFNFPSSPSNGDLFSSGGWTWRWDSTNSLWRTVNVTQRQLRYEFVAKGGFNRVFPVYHSPGQVQAFVNGVRKTYGVDFIAENGIEVEFAADIATDAKVSVISSIATPADDYYTTTEVDAVLPAEGYTIGGMALFTGGSGSSPVTYTPPANVKALKFEFLSPGGGGGGVDGEGAGTSAIGSGGNGGNYCVAFVEGEDIETSYSGYACGSAGLNGGYGNADGTAGNIVFGDYVVTGGAGGNGGLATSGVRLDYPYHTLNAHTGTFLVTAEGGSGHPGSSSGTVYAQYGMGGDAAGPYTNGSGQLDGAGRVYGGGGAGARVSGTSDVFSGEPGGCGVVVVTEYY